MLSLPRRAFARTATVLVALTPLVLTSPAHADDPAHAPTLNCDVFWRYNGVLVWGGVAVAAAGHGGVRRLTLTCLYENSAGRYVSQNEAAAPVVVISGGGLLAAGSMTWCGSATAIYDDGHSATTSTCS